MQHKLPSGAVLAVTTITITTIAAVAPEASGTGSR
jgi:hypothetical protein